MSQYKAYPAYKDSGVEWIGQVPEHWEVKPICRVTSVNDDALSDSTTGSTRISYVDISSVGYTEGIKQATEMAFEDAPSRARRKASTGDVVVSTVRTYLKAVAAVTDEYADCIFSTGFAVLRARQLEQSFLKWMILNELLVQAIEAHSEGLSYPAINASALVKLKSVIPPPEEQVTIAATLDRETSRIDALIQKKTRFIELLKEKVIATAMTEQMYGDGEHIRLRHLVQIISRPVQLISEDEYIALGLYNRGRGLFHKPPTLGKDIGDSDFFYVEEGDLILSGQFAWEGAVTMASSTESGCVVSHRYPIVRGGAVATEYLFALLMTNFGDFLLNESSRGSAGRNRPLNINLLLNEKIRMPSVKTQEEIKGLIKLKATLEEKVKHSIDLLKERRAAFITAAVTGQIDLRGEQ